MNSGGEVVAGLGHGAGRADALQEAGGLACGDFLAEAPRDKVAQHSVEPAGHLVPCPAQIPVPVGPHLQHRGMAGRSHLGRRLAQMVQLAVEYDPCPPLDAGSPSKAPAQMAGLRAIIAHHAAMPAPPGGL